MVECINEGKHIVFFLPRHVFLACVGQIKESPAKRNAVMMTWLSLGAETSMSMSFDEDLDLSPMFHTASYLMIRPDNKTVRLCSVVAIIDTEAGFTTLPVKRVGLVVHSYMVSQNNQSFFNWDAGVFAYSSTSKRVGRSYIMSQRQSCRGVQARQVYLYNGKPGAGVDHPVDQSRDFLLQVIRSWPGKQVSQIPLNLGKRDARRLGRTLDHLTVAGIIEPRDNGYVLTKTKGVELVEVLPKAVSSGLSFELAVLVASARHCVIHERSMRLLIRLAVVGSRVSQFMAELNPGHAEEGVQTASFLWMKEAQEHMAGPARGEMLAGRLWFALGIWDKMRKDTNNFSITVPQNGDEPGYEEGDLYTIEGIGKFYYGTAVEIFMCVLELEDRLGLPLLGPSDPAWEEPLEVAELQEVQVQLMLAYISDLAVWNVAAGDILLVGSRHPLALAPSSLVAHPHIAEIERRPRKGYLIIPDCVRKGEDRTLSALSATRVPLSLLRLITTIVGEPAEDWLKWP